MRKEEREAGEGSVSGCSLDEWYMQWLIKGCGRDGDQLRMLNWQKWMVAFMNCQLCNFSKVLLDWKMVERVVGGGP